MDQSHQIPPNHGKQVSFRKKGNSLIRKVAEGYPGQPHFTSSLVRVGVVWILGDINI
jgi:hypothetical protein